jgi:hypothetical protein
MRIAPNQVERASSSISYDEIDGATLSSLRIANQFEPRQLHAQAIDDLYGSIGTSAIGHDDPEARRGIQPTVKLSQNPLDRVLLIEGRDDDQNIRV